MAKPFNLKSAQMSAPVAPVATDMTAAPDTTGTATGNIPSSFQDGNDVKDWLENGVGNASDAITALSGLSNENQTVQDPDTQLSGSIQDTVHDAVNDFFSNPDEQSRLEAASIIFDTVIPAGMKAQTGESQMGSQPDVGALVASVDAELKKLAQTNAAKTAKQSVFNLRKEAQHKTLENVVVLGPNNHIDQFTGQLINDWHLIERNKGFGLKVDGLLNMDFEKVWRENIMDKYYPGYLEARFEVDKMIPPTNNLQLKPGEKTRITPPEYGITGARLEAARTKMNEERGYSPSEDGKPFNWKEAVSDKKKVTAQLNPTPGIKDLPDAFALPGDEKAKETIKVCPFCHNTLKTGSTECPTCKMNVTPQDTGQVKMAPDQPGAQDPTAIAQQTAIQKNTLLNAPLAGRVNQFLHQASSETPEDGIFFDGSNFICYADQKKHQFTSYEDAEQFKTAKTELQHNPVDFKQMPSSIATNPGTLRKRRPGNVQPTNQTIYTHPSCKDSSIQGPDAQEASDQLGL